MNRIHNTALVVALFLLSGCMTPVKRMDAGTHTIGQRMSVTLDSAWNHLDVPEGKPALLWTREGIYIDRLLVYSGLKDGGTIHPAGTDGVKRKDVVFRKTMQAEDLVTMFESMLTRDQSIMRIVKSEPYAFGGKPGVRFEFERTRKLDNVQELGIGYAAVDRDELFAILYVAPRLTFFPRYRSTVEDIAKAAEIRG